MPATIIDGKAVAQRVTDEVRADVAAFVAAGHAPPGLAVVLVGDNAASQVYVRNKRKTTDAVGMRSFAFDLPAERERRRAAGAGRPPQRRSRRPRHPGAVAAARRPSIPSA